MLGFEWNFDSHTVGCDLLQLVILSVFVSFGCRWWSCNFQLFYCWFLVVKVRIWQLLVDFKGVLGNSIVKASTIPQNHGLVITTALHLGILVDVILGGSYVYHSFLVFKCDILIRLLVLTGTVDLFERFIQGEGICCRFGVFILHLYTLEYFGRLLLIPCYTFASCSHHSHQGLLA